jgi:glutamate dehydrogenase/leucine dehydrogenase
MRSLKMSKEKFLKGCQNLEKLVREGKIFKRLARRELITNGRIGWKGWDGTYIVEKEYISAWNSTVGPELCFRKEKKK